MHAVISNGFAWCLLLAPHREVLQELSAPERLSQLLEAEQQHWQQHVAPLIAKYEQNEANLARLLAEQQARQEQQRRQQQLQQQLQEVVLAPCSGGSSGRGGATVAVMAGAAGAAALQAASKL